MEKDNNETKFTSQYSDMKEGRIYTAIGRLQDISFVCEFLNYHGNKNFAQVKLLQDVTWPSKYKNFAHDILTLAFQMYNFAPYSKSTAIGKDIEFPVHVLQEDKHIYTVLVNGDVTIHGLRIPSMSKVELCKVHFKVKEIE